VAAFHGVWARGGARVHFFGNPYGKEFLMDLVAADRRFVRLALVVVAVGGVATACGESPLEPRRDRVRNPTPIARSSKQRGDQLDSVRAQLPSGGSAAATGGTLVWY
jgi:hypothetical protein